MPHDPNLDPIETHVAALVFLEHPTKEALRERYAPNKVAVQKTMRALGRLMRAGKVVERRGGKLDLNTCRHCKGTGYGKKRK
jgi:hypothetical protein